MKWFVFTILAFLFVGCSSVRERNESYQVSGFDFTPFVEKGFYYSPNTYNGKYVTMGTLDILFLSEVKFSNQNEYQNPPEGYAVYLLADYYLKFKLYSAQELMEKMYQEALELNGNGIMNFKMTLENDSYYGTYNPRFTGTVIKIQE